MRNIEKEIISTEEFNLICKYIKLRNESNISQSELARRVGIARSTIARMERNLHSISLGTFVKLSEYGYVFEIDSINLGLTIDYHITDWYINENYYLEKSLVYNSVSIFYLIDNVDYIKFNFSGKSYKINRKTIETIYPNYKDIKDTRSFKEYVEDKMNDIDFIDSIFKKLS